jgi:ribonuclease HIII
LLAHDLAILQSPEYNRLSKEVIDVKRMLAALIHKLRAES